LTLRRTILSAVLTSCVLLVAVPAFADPVTPNLMKSVTFTSPAAAKTDDPTAVSGGFSLFHFYGQNYAGFYGTFAQRVTKSDHPIAVVGQVSFHHSGFFSENPITFMGGAQATLMHDDNICVSGRGLVGITHWPDSNDLTFQITGVVDIHMKQIKGLSIEVEGGVVINHSSDGGTGKGIVINAGVMKTFGGS
jgi:hypothetical protein